MMMIVQYGILRLMHTFRLCRFKLHLALSILGRYSGKFSPIKIVAVVFTQELEIPNLQLKLENNPIPFQNNVKFLGLSFDRRVN